MPIVMAASGRADSSERILAVDPPDFFRGIDTLMRKLKITDQLQNFFSLSELHCSHVEYASSHAPLRWEASSGLLLEMEPAAITSVALKVPLQSDIIQELLDLQVPRPDRPGRTRRPLASRRAWPHWCKATFRWLMPSRRQRR